MARKRHPTEPPPATLPAIYTVRAEDKIEPNRIERDAWTVFLSWCHQVPEGTKVELLRNGKVCAWLTAAGTRVSRMVPLRDVASAADVA
jgi:hypothetical protein